MTDSKSARRLSGGIAIIVLLTICLAVTTFALVHVSVQVENNVFHTGTVKIIMQMAKITKSQTSRLRINFSAFILYYLSLGISQTACLDCFLPALRRRRA